MSYKLNHFTKKFDIDTRNKISDLDDRYVNVSGDTMTGQILLSGSGKVYKNEWIPVDAIRVPTTNPATAIDWGISVGWEFTNGTNDVIYATIRMPQDMDKTDAPQFKIGFASATNTGNVVWQLEYLYVSQNESTVASAQETLTATQAISAVANGLTIATITGMDLPAAADQLIVLRIKRLGGDAADTLEDDCVLLGCGLRYTSDRLGVAV